MSTRNISWGGKVGRCVGLTTLPPSCADCHEIWEPQLLGTLRVCLGTAKGLLYLNYCTTVLKNKINKLRITSMKLKKPRILDLVI
jgi:hypothetical protein